MIRRASGWTAISALLMLLGSCRGRGESFELSDTYRNAPVILISIDTLRADHLPAYGYSGVTTPNIDSLRADSILYANAYSHCPLTLPSHATLLTGKLPNEIAVRDNIGYTLGATSGSIPQFLKERGYETGAAVSSYVLRGETGLGKLFDWYDDAIAFQPGLAAGSIQRPGSATIESALQWIRQRPRKRFFFFLHLFEPHSPYEAPEPFRNASSSSYDGEIAYVDSLVGRFLDELKRQGLYDRAIIVLLSDHGEGLGDHGEREHGILLYREALHVPLMLKLPNGTAAGHTVTRPVGLIDVAPTIAILTGGHVPSALRGVPLTARLEEKSLTASRRIYAESLYGRLHLGWSELRSLVDGRHHFIEAPRPELYDLLRDSRERNNVIADNRRVQAVFREELSRFPRNLSAPAPLRSEEAKKLAALGYLTASPMTMAGPLPDPKENIEQLSLYEEANGLVRARQYERASAAFQALLEKNPRFADAKMQLATCYEATGSYLQAEAAYRGLLQENPAMTEQVAIALGVVYMNLRRYGEAASHARLALQTNPGGAHLLLGRVAMARGDYDAAEKYARKAGADAHFRSAAALLTAEALIRQRRMARALEILEQERQILARTHALPVRSLELRRADALMRLDRVPEAEVAFKEEIRLFPDNRDAYTTLAGVYVLQGRTADAEAVLEALVGANPTRSSYSLARKTLEVLGRGVAAAKWRRREQAMTE